MAPYSTPTDPVSMVPFHGVAPESLYAIGCITTAAGELEWIARDLLRNLYADPGRDLLGEVLKRIRRQLEANAVPDHARVTLGEIVTWTHDVRDVLGERHELAHSAPLKRAQQSPDGDLTDGAREDASPNRDTGGLES